ncbi:MAG TPA: DnaJ domain-containing protein [bacterium]|nr:DnaJ domain-containing protein [bacterium]
MGIDRAEHCRRMLGVGENADLGELKRAFRKKASKMHPDVNHNDPMAVDTFKKITAAYEFLKSRALDEKRKKKAEEKHIRPAAENEYSVSPKDLSLEELSVRLKFSDNPYVRLHAVRIIESVGGKQGAWALVQALKDEDTIVISEAVKALGRLRARVAAIPLIQLHRNCPPQLKKPIENALENIDSPMCEKYLELIGKKTDVPKPGRVG